MVLTQASHSVGQRKADVSSLLKGQGDKLSNAEIARRCGVYGRYVSQVRKMLGMASSPHIAREDVLASQADKRKEIADTLRTTEYAGWSNVRIARLCGVSPPTVAKVRKIVEQEDSVVSSLSVEGDQSMSETPHAVYPTPTPLTGGIRGDMRRSDDFTYIGTETTTEYILLSQFVIDERVQRGAKTAWQRETAQKFDADLFLKPFVARRPDGMYAVLDGQQRLGVLRILHTGQEGRIKVLCDVFEPRAIEHEAKMFRAHNVEITNVTRLESFRVRLTENDEKAHRLVDALQSEGFEIARTARSQDRNRFGCIKALEDMLDANPEVLATTLRILHRAWGGETAGVQQHIIQGVFNVVSANLGRVDKTAMIRRLARVLNGGSTSTLSARELDKKVRAIQGAYEIKTPWIAVARYICDQNNEGLAEDMQLVRPKG